MNSSPETVHRSISFREPFPSGISDKLRTFLNAVSGPNRRRRACHLTTGGQTSQDPARVRPVSQRWVAWMRFRISILFMAVGCGSLLSSLSLSDDIRHRSKSITRSSRVRRLARGFTFHDTGHDKCFRGSAVEERPARDRRRGRARLFVRFRGSRSFRIRRSYA